MPLHVESVRINWNQSSSINYTNPTAIAAMLFSFLQTAMQMNVTRTGGAPPYGKERYRSTHLSWFHFDSFRLRFTRATICKCTCCRWTPRTGATFYLHLVIKQTHTQNNFKMEIKIHSPTPPLPSSRRHFLLLVSRLTRLHASFFMKNVSRCSASGWLTVNYWPCGPTPRRPRPVHSEPCYCETELYSAITVLLPCFIIRFLSDAEKSGRFCSICMFCFVFAIGKKNQLSSFDGMLLISVT